MKKKIVIKLSMNDEECRSKALKIAACTPGVESVAITGQDKNQVEAVGDGIDSVCLTRRLRKKFAHADLESVSEVKKEDKPPAKKPKDTEQPPAKEALPPPFIYGVPPYPCYCCDVISEPTCTIQ